MEGGWRNAIANPVIGGMGLPIMHTWNYSVQLWQFHHHYQVWAILVLSLLRAFELHICTLQIL